MSRKTLRQVEQVQGILHEIRRVDKEEAYTLIRNYMDMELRSMPKPKPEQADTRRPKAGRARTKKASARAAP
jgi:hypothetical protein